MSKIHTEKTGVVGLVMAFLWLLEVGSVSHFRMVWVDK